MKKTLLAVALATSAFSGQALAWSNGSVGGNFEMGGTFTAEALPTQVWEAKIGSASALDAKLNNTDTTVTIPVTADIPVLGMRVANADGLIKAVTGSTNNPEIQYGGGYDVTALTNGVGSLTLDVMDSGNTKIGSINANLTTVALGSLKNTSSTTVRSLFADNGANPRGFKNGLSNNANGAIQSPSDAKALITKLFPDALTRFDDQGGTDATTAMAQNFNLSSSGAVHSAAYASGIESGTNLTINLDKPLTADTQWKATFPITISYL
ncbi:TPA: hypothetical protein ON570_004202 [Citrobacter werkmanii]|nr:hypothetical protein [Citrobacter werkmanii]